MPPNDPIDPHDHPLCDTCREIGCECAREWSFVALVCRCGWSLLRMLPPCIPHRVRCPRCGKVLDVPARPPPGR